MDKKLLWGFIAILVVNMVCAVCVPPGGNSTSEGIYITNCGANTSTVACNGTIQFTCTVLDNICGTSGIQNNSGFVFNIQRNNYAPVAYKGFIKSGTIINGTWAANVVVSKDDNTLNLGTDSYTIYSVSAVDSTSNTCSASTLYDGSGCKVNFTSTRTVSSSCVCSLTATYGTCNVYDLQNRTSSGAACQSAYTDGSVSCDFCNPLWTPSYTGCTLDDYQYMVGDSSKTYVNGAGSYPNGTSCCGLTSGKAGSTVYRAEYSGGSDCDKPADDGTTQDCTLDSWTRQGRDIGSTSKHQPENGVILVGPLISGTDYSTGETFSDYTASYGVTYQPVVFDLDNDGTSETVMTKGTSARTYVMQSSGVFGTELSKTFAYSFVGAPSIYGVEYIGYSNSYQCSNGTIPSSSPCSINVVSVVNDSGTFKVVFLDSTLTQRLMSGALSNAVSPNVGVACYGKNCYVKDVLNNAYKINAVTGAVTKYGLQNTTVSDSTRTTPIFGDFNGGGDIEIAWAGNSDGIGAVGGFICETDLNLTMRLCVGPLGDRVKGMTTVDNGNPGLDIIYTSEQDSYGGGAYVAYSKGKIEFYNPLYAWADDQVFWVGLTTGCLSNPINMECGGSPGVGLVHYNGASISTSLQTPFLYSSGENDNQIMYKDVVWDGAGYSSSSSISHSATNSVYIVDFNNDGAEDILSVDSNYLYVYNKNLAQVTSYNTGTIYGSTKMEDIDGDGRYEFMYFDNVSFKILNMINNTLSLEYSLNITSGQSVNSDFYLYDSSEDSKMMVYLTTNSTNMTLWKVTSSSANNYTYKSKVLTVPPSTDRFLMHAGEDLDGDGFLDAVVATSDYSVDYYNVSIYSLSPFVLQKNFGIVPGFTTSNAYGVLYLIDASATGVGVGTGRILIGQVGSCAAGACGARTYDYNAGALSSIGCGGYAGGYYQSCSFSELLSGDSPMYKLHMEGANWAGYAQVLAQNLSAIASLSAAGLGSNGYSAQESIYPVTDNNGNYDHFVGYMTQYGPTGPANYSTRMCKVSMSGGTFSESKCVLVGSLSGAQALYDLNGDGSADYLRGSSVFYSTGAAVQPTYSYAECINPLTLNVERSLALPGSTCAVSGGITAFDTNGDNWDEIIGGSGIIDLYNGNINALFSANDAVIPIDLNNDRWMDFLATSNSLTTVKASNPTFEWYVAGLNTSIVAMKPCAVDSKGVLTLGVVAKAPQPEFTIDVNYGDLNTESHNYPDITFTHAYERSGTYNITATVTTSTAATASASCSVVATVAANDGCSIGNDGVFTYTDSVVNHDWNVEFGANVFPKSGYLTFSGSTSYGIGHSLGYKSSCNQNGVILSMDAAIDTNSEFYLQYSAATSNVNSRVETPVSIKFKDGNIYVPTATDWVKVSSYTSARTMYNVSIDTSKKIYQLYVGGTLIFEGDIASLESSTVISPSTGVVNTIYQYGLAKVYSIKTVGFGGITKRILPSEIKDELKEGNADISKLSGCVESSPTFKSGNSKSYPNINAYCSSKGGCGADASDQYKELKNIVIFSPACYKEAMNYCVDVIYPQSVHMETGRVSSADGLFVCSTILNVQMGAQKIGKPIMSAIWSLAQANLFEVILFVIIVIIIFSVANNNRKGN